MRCRKQWRSGSWGLVRCMHDAPHFGEHRWWPTRRDYRHRTSVGAWTSEDQLMPSVPVERPRTFRDWWRKTNLD